MGEHADEIIDRMIGWGDYNPYQETNGWRSDTIRRRMQKENAEHHGGQWWDPVDEVWRGGGRDSRQKRVARGEWSSAKGTILIMDMTDTHLQHAIKFCDTVPNSYDKQQELIKEQRRRERLRMLDEPASYYPSDNQGPDR